MNYTTNPCETCSNLYIDVHHDHSLRTPNYLASKYMTLYILLTSTLREESSQNNVILKYKLQAAILSAVCSVI